MRTLLQHPWFAKNSLRWGNVVMVALGLSLFGEPVARAENSPSLFEPLPIDRSAVDESATLRRRIRAEPSSLNPILMYTRIDAEFDYLLWDRPFVVDAELNTRLNPNVATAYTESADHLTGTLTLKPNQRWHDGAPLTAEDVAFSWRCIMDDNVIARKARSGADQLANCRAIAPDTVVFTFKRALATNRRYVDFPILPKHIYEPIARKDPSLANSGEASKRNRAPIGNGPYRFVEWADGQRVVLERWADYPGTSPAFRRIVFQVIPDNHAALLAIETGQLDETQLTPQQFARETDEARFAEHAVKAKGPGDQTYYVGWNVRGSSTFLMDQRVRQALSHAIDIQQLIDRVFFGLFEPSTGVFHPNSWVGPTGCEPYAFDLARAATLLDDAGWTRDPDDGWRYAQMLSREGKITRVPAAFTLNLVQGSQTSPKIADLYRANLQKIGVKLTTQTLDWSVFNERNFRGEFDAYLSAWTPGADPDDAWNLFHSSERDGGRNYPGYASDAVDALLEKGRVTFDESARRECYRALARQVHADAPYTFIVSAPSLWAFSKNLHGVELGPLGPTLCYPGVLSWWIERGDDD